MGLHGFKPKADVTTRNNRIWRAYLMVRVMGFKTREVYDEVSRLTNLPRSTVVAAVHSSSPVGCYDK